MSRIMAIDYGDVRIGIALTDPLQIIAGGHSTILNDINIFNNIFKICKEKAVESVVIGIPFDENSEVGFTAKKVLSFAGKLVLFFQENVFSVEFFEQDERYTTSDAYDIIKTNKVKRKNKKKIVDQIAATRILEDFMHNRNKTKLDLNKYSL
jgi:putative Holliday junction resolvase